MALCVTRSDGDRWCLQLHLGAFLTRRERPSPQISRWLKDRATASSSLLFPPVHTVESNHDSPSLCSKATWAPPRCRDGILLTGAFHQAVEPQAASETCSSLPCFHFGILLKFFWRREKSLVEFEERNVESTQAHATWTSILFIILHKKRCREFGDGLENGGRKRNSFFVRDSHECTISCV